MAQSNSDQFRPFNGFFAGLFDDGSPTPQRQVQNNSDYNSHGNAATAHGAHTCPQPQPAPQLDDAPSLRPSRRSGQLQRRSSTRPVTSNIGSPGSATGSNYSFQYDDGPPQRPCPQSASARQPGRAAIRPRRSATAPTGMPLHERLKIFRQSPFGDTAQTTPSAADPPLPPPTLRTRPASRHHSNTATRPARRRSVSPPADVPPTNPAPAVEPQRPADRQVRRRRRTRAERSDRSQESAAVGGNHRTAEDRRSARKLPMRCLLQNSGDVAAEEVTVTVSLPEWAEVAGASASAGEVRPIAARPSRSLPLGAGANRSPFERKARPEDHSQAEQAIRVGRSLGLQAGAVAGHDRSPGAEADDATGRPSRSVLRQAGSLQAETGQQRKRPGGKRPAHAHAAECRRHASDIASPGHDQCRRRAHRSKSN